MDLSELIQYVIEGPTNHTAYHILKSLQKALQKGTEDSIDYAISEYQHDGDKLDAKARGIIEKLLGCRTHLQHDCMQGMCGYFKEKKRRNIENNNS